MAADVGPTIWWLRRDFRLADNPALRAAIDEGEAVLPLFVLDPVLLRSAGAVRRAWLFAALHALDTELREAGGPGLSVVRGKPSNAVLQVARACGARQVHVSSDFAPYGRARDEAVSTALASSEIDFRRTGSPYAVAPGTLTNGSGGPYQVFSPFHRAWAEHGVHAPAPGVRAGSVDWLTAVGQTRLEKPDPDLVALAGERPARRAWKAWLDADSGGVKDYADLHDFPGPDATSHLSIALRWGHLHPRTVLADLASRRSKGAAALARQIAWRDFFADVLFHRPDAVSQPIRPEFKAMPTDEPDPHETGRRAVDRLAAGPHRLPAGGRRHAPVARRGLDAQPGADGRGLVPDQGPAHRLVARRRLVHGAPARR